MTCGVVLPRFPVPSLSDTTVCASGEVPLEVLYDQVLGPYPGSLTMLLVMDRDVRQVVDRRTRTRWSHRAVPVVVFVRVGLFDVDSGVVVDTLTQVQGVGVLDSWMSVLVLEEFSPVLSHLVIVSRHNIPVGDSC